MIKPKLISGWDLLFGFERDQESAVRSAIESATGYSFQMEDNDDIGRHFVLAKEDEEVLLIRDNADFQGQFVEPDFASYFVLLFVFRTLKPEFWKRTLGRQDQVVDVLKEEATDVFDITDVLEAAFRQRDKWTIERQELASSIICSAVTGAQINDEGWHVITASNKRLIAYIYEHLPLVCLDAPCFLDAGSASQVATRLHHENIYTIGSGHLPCGRLICEPKVLYKAFEGAFESFPVETAFTRRMEDSLRMPFSIFELYDYTW